MRAYVPFYLAANYMAFAFVAALGVLQAALVASGDRRLAISAWPQHPCASLAIAGVWTAGAFALYWFCAPELLTPGPAGAELTALFGLATLLAIGLTRLLARLRGTRLPGAGGTRSRQDAPGAGGEEHATCSALRQYLSRTTHHVSRFTSHVSRLTSHVSRFTFHVSRFTFHVSRFTFHVSRFTSYAPFSSAFTICRSFAHLMG